MAFRLFLGEDENVSWDGALSQEFTGTYTPDLQEIPPKVLALPLGAWWTLYANLPATIPVDVPDDLVADLFHSVNGGEYWVIVEAEVIVPTPYAVFKRLQAAPTKDGNSNPLAGYQVTWGAKHL